MGKTKVQVLSPDGITIEDRFSYSSMKQAMSAYEKWKKRYETQGFYSSVDYGRIPVAELDKYCVITEI